MPILLALIVAIVWLGFSVVGQSQVAVEARQKAWVQRFEDQGTGLLFLKDDIVSESATSQVSVTPLLNDFSPPKSKHDVLVGTWDHKTLAMDRPPHWKEYAIAAANAKTGTAQVAYNDARNQFNEWKRASSDIWQTLSQSLMQQLTGWGESASSSIGAARETQADTSRESAKVDQEIVRVESELSAVGRRLAELKGDLRKADSAANEETLRARIQMHENKEARLKAELSQWKDDRRELNR